MRNRGICESWLLPSYSTCTRSSLLRSASGSTTASPSAATCRLMSSASTFQNLGLGQCSSPWITLNNLKLFHLFDIQWITYLGGRSIDTCSVVLFPLNGGHVNLNPEDHGSSLVHGAASHRRNQPLGGRVTSLCEVRHHVREYFGHVLVSLCEWANGEVAAITS